MNQPAGDDAAPDVAPADAASAAAAPTDAASVDAASADAVSATVEIEAPAAIDDDEDVIDAEIVESTVLTPTAYGNPEAYGSLPAPDYNDAGVPSLDYVRDKIEGRHATAIGSAELAQAAADREGIAKAAAQDRAYLTADQQRAAREQAAKDKLDEIRRSLHP